MGGNVGAD